MCTAGISFSLDGLTLSGDGAGVGIRLTGKRTSGDEAAEIVIYKLRDGISCFRVRRCPNDEHQECQIQLAP
jgi:hypothetical protein